MEVLSQKIQHEVDRGNWKGVHTARRGTQVSHLFFADDLILFGKASKTQACLMEQVLKDFCCISG